MGRRAVLIVATMAVGLVAGIMLGTGTSLYSARALPETSWTQSFQLDDAVFAQVMIPLFAVALVALIAASLLTRRAGRLLYAAAALLFALAVLITVTRNVPINLQVKSWTAGSAPADWASVRDSWLWSHLARSVATFGAFLCATFGLASSAAAPAHRL